MMEEWVGSELGLSIMAGLLVAAILWIFRHVLVTSIRSAFDAISRAPKGPTPILSFEPEHQFDGTSTVASARLTNASETAAYNVHAFTAERWPDGSFKIRSLGDVGLQKTTFGSRDKIERHDIDMYFQGSSAMIESWYWIEYDNIHGEHFRIVISPMSPRGDAPSAKPPKRIRRRLECWPGTIEEGPFDHWEMINLGEASFESFPGRLRRWWIQRGRKQKDSLIVTRHGDFFIAPFDPEPGP